MSHEIMYYEYDESVDKNEVEADLNYVASMEGWREGSSGLSNSITWHDNIICENYSSAREYIDKIDNGWYDQIAVKYKEIIPGKKTKAQIKKEDQENELRKELDFLETRNFFKNHKSKKITCKKCESNINKDYIRRNRCPVCGNDLRSKTELKKIERKEEKLDVLREQIREMEVKSSKNHKIKWLVKIEFHS